MKKFFKGLVVALAATAIIGVVSADDQVVYGYGGAQVGWNASLFAEDDKVVPMAGEDKYFSLDATGNGEFEIDVKAGDVVDFYDLCWDGETGCVHQTVTLTDGDATKTLELDFATGDVKVAPITPSASYTAVNDGKLKVAVAYSEAIGAAGAFNDWCGNAIVVTTKTAAETTESTASETASEAASEAASSSAADKNNKTGDSTAVAILAIVALASLTGAVVIKKHNA